MWNAWREAGLTVGEAEGVVTAIFAPSDALDHHDTATIARGTLVEVVAAAELLPMEVQASTTIYLSGLTAMSLADARAQLAQPGPA